MANVRRSLVAALCSAALLVFVGCGGGQSANSAKSAENEVPVPSPIPSDLAALVERSSSLGRTLHVYDAASAIGTSVLLSNVKLEQQSIGGYLTIPEGNEQGQPTGSFNVFFYTRDPDPKLAFRILIHPEGQPTFEAKNPPVDAPEGLRPLIRARETALAAPRDTQQPINPIVLPGAAIGESGILVYLLAGTNQPKLAVFGKHYRVLVSEDGRTVKRVDPLTQTAIEIPFGARPDGPNPEALIIGHFFTDYPLETHVFASLLYKLPVHVQTSRGQWNIDGPTITFFPTRTIPVGKP